MTENSYMTVGEIARKAGVTVRTVQYYDQIGLLHPCKRNDREWRVYTEDDLETLSRIICGRFTGMSLDEIKEDIQVERKPVDVIPVLQDSIDDCESILLEQMKRMAVLKDLERFISKSGELDWKDCMRAIEYLQNKWTLIWELNQNIDSGHLPTTPTKTDEESMNACYSLIIDTIHLMRDGVSPESDEAATVIERYEQIVSGREDEYSGISYKDMININTDIMKTDIAEIPDFWGEIKNYLKAAADTYHNKKETE